MTSVHLKLYVDARHQMHAYGSPDAARTFSLAITFSRHLTLGHIDTPCTDLMITFNTYRHPMIYCRVEMNSAFILMYTHSLFQCVL